MPSGTLGYAGTVNFSARDVVASLRKIEAIAPNVILPGHGPNGDPAPYLVLVSK
ncbi:MAG: glyoxylase-like metal-dependent hydrolase (beta-lactamase superfamily II) [Pseudoalteromonas tetraodonis]|jgi:glyoxylase-like metal-dependent hydrolase (beta-lactamase superfamily II)